jgi:hypothetical protein
MTTLTPSISISELRFVCTRAAVGAGTPFGFGEDFAETAITLAKMGFDAVSVARPCLEGLASQESSGVVELRGVDGVMCFDAESRGVLSAIYAGPALCDHLIVNGMNSSARLVRVDSPLLAVAGLAAVLTEAVSGLVSWQTDAGEKVSLFFDDGQLQSISAPNVSAVMTSGPADVSVSVGENVGCAEGDILFEQKDFANSSLRALTEGLQMDAAAWAAVYSYFARCLVPSSAETLLSGAGAGLVDTD